MGVIAGNEWMTTHIQRHASVRLVVPTYDVWISNFGVPLVKHHYLPDLLGAGMFALFVGTMWFGAVLDLDRFVRVHSFLLAVRLACIGTTYGYASPRLHAETKASGGNSSGSGRARGRGEPSLSSDSSVRKGGFNSGSFDLVISGHTMLKVLLFLHLYDQSPLWYSLPAGVFAVFAVSSNLLVGDHYSSDIILAVVLTYLSHYSCLF